MKSRQLIHRARAAAAVPPLSTSHMPALYMQSQQSPISAKDQKPCVSCML